MSLPDPEEALAKARDAVKPEEDAKPKKRLPATKIFEIDVTSEWGERTKGRFRYTVPNIGAQIEVGQLKATYLPSGAAADVNAAMVVDMVCYLAVCITFDDAFPRPDWWNPMKAYDATPYTELYGRCLAYEARFHSRSSDDAGDEGQLRGEAEPRGDAPVRVGEAVQPPPQRRETLAGDGAGGA